MNETDRIDALSQRVIRLEQDLTEAVMASGARIAQLGELTARVVHLEDMYRFFDERIEAAVERADEPIPYTLAWAERDDDLEEAAFWEWAERDMAWTDEYLVSTGGQLVGWPAIIWQHTGFFRGETLDGVT